MSIPVHQLKADHWYITTHREVRRIDKIEKSRVTYQSTTRDSGEVSWSKLTTVAVAKFAREVVREVPRRSRTLDQER